MELIKLALRPGIVKELSRLGGEGGWYDSDKIRFRYGLPERMGGWQNINGQGNTTTFKGIARASRDWQDNSIREWLALGTHKKLYAWASEVYNDITPLRTSVGGTNNFSTSAGSPLILVSSPAHNEVVGGFFNLTSITTTLIGGVSVSAGEYEVVSITNDTFFVSIATAPFTSLTAGGAWSGYFHLSPGEQHNTGGFGWGAGGWSHAGGWGTSAPSSGILVGLRTWSLDNWGEELIANPRGGGIYHWGLDVNSRASAITGAPSRANFVMVSPEDRILIAFGVPDIATSVYNPLYARWCDQENFNLWVPAATNTAGDKLFSGGTKIMAGYKSKGQILVWTDQTLYSMQQVSDDFVFRFQVVGEQSGLVSPYGGVEADGVFRWMGDQNFQEYAGGSVRVIDCPVNRFVFDNLDRDQLDKTVAGHHAEFSEIYWFYQDITASEINRYVCLNYRENTWTVGTLARTTWTDRGIFGYPIAAGDDGKTYFQDFGYSADGSVIASYLDSNEFDMKDGEDIIFLDRVVPDVTNIDGTANTGQVNFTVQARRYSNSTPTTKGPYGISAGTEKIDLRARGRTIQLSFSSSGTNDKWRLSPLRLRVGLDGKR